MKNNNFQIEITKEECKPKCKYPGCNNYYTYSINEWRAILDLRYYGTTGAPHPNAKIIAGMIRQELIELGYDFR